MSEPYREEEDPIEYNVMDIDFDKLISEETDEEIIKMHKYFRDVQPTPMNVIQVSSRDIT